ncbi:MAG: DUF5615 family PIN-like protein [Acidobacteria bacterium]|nr:DUF5615 family PIN-like protein [Acidobacteriota bacterium]
MIRFLAGENLNRNIVRALGRRYPGIDVAIAQDVGLTGVPDGALLAWAADHWRVLLSHDFRTLAAEAERRLRRGEPMHGLLLIRRPTPVARAAEDLALVLECSTAAEWVGRIEYLPL